MQQKTVALESYALISAPLGGLGVWVPVGEAKTKEPMAVLLIRPAPAGAPPPADAIEAADVIRRLGSVLADN